MPNLNEKQRKFLGWLVVAAAITLAGYLGFTHPLPEPPEDIIQLGTTHFGSLELEDDLTVGDDATITGDLAVTGNIQKGSLYSVLAASAREVYAASGTFTGTLAVAAGTHGLSAVTAAFCTLGETPATGSGDGALCWAGVSGTTVTFTVEQDDWVSNSTNSTLVYYLIIGTP